MTFSAKLRILACAGLVCLSLAARGALATPVCATSGTGNPYICVDKSGANPEEGTDFSFGFSDEANPDVTLLVGNDAWIVYAQASSSDPTPANIGDITIDPDVLSDDFEVSIINGTGDGAEDVGSIVLDIANFTGYSSIEGGTINGNVTGAITVVEDSGGNGGELDLTIQGDAEGDITAQTIASGDFLTILGDLDGAVNIIGEMAGTISISQSISSTGELDLDGEVTNQITIGQDVDGHINVNDKLKGAQIVFLGDLASAGTITIADMISDGPTNSKVESQGTVFGDITLSTGIKLKQLINLETLGNGGLIDLDGSDLAGELTLEQASSGSSITGGAVTGTATLANVSSLSNFAGSATFTSVSSAGTIQTTDSANVTGTVTISGAMAGAVDVDGDLSGTIDINGASSGTIVVEGDTSGTIDILNDCTGEVSLTGSCSGDVIVGGALRDFIVLKNDLTSAGSITVDGDVRSDI